MRLAIVQDGPEYLDKSNTLVKTLEFIKQASREGADLIVFGECWFSGYPVWLDICKDVNLWDHEPVKSVWQRMFEHGLSIRDPEMLELSSAIKECAIHVVMGANEAVRYGKGNGTIYNSIFTFDRKGRLVNHHRKLMPTYTENLVHGLGDGQGLKSVDMGFGRVGSLICWEHWMPLARQAMHDEGEDLHIALWPFVKEMHHVACRHYAHEGKCFTIAVGQIMHQSELPEELAISNMVSISDDGFIMRGGSAIYGPNGEILLSAIYGEKQLIIRDLDLTKTIGERMNLSVSGHYQRNDIFNLDIKRDRN